MLLDLKTSEMKINVQRQMKAHTDVLWRYLSDFSNIYEFHPFLKRSRYVEGSCLTGIGTERACYMLDGSFMKERVVEWEEGKFYTVELIESSLPIASARATLGVSPIDKKISRAYMHMEMETKYALLKPFFFFTFKYLVGPAILRGLDQASLRERKAIAAYSGFSL